MAQYQYGGADTLTLQKLPGYKKIVAWQVASDLSAMVMSLVQQFSPGYYRLSDQMLAAALAIAANIAEGYCSGTIGNYVRYAEIARGSAGELGSYIQDCERWGLVQGDELHSLVKQYSLTTYFTDRLLQALRDKRKADTWERGLPAKEPAAVYHLTGAAEWNALYGDRTAEQISGITDDWPDASP